MISMLHRFHGYNSLRFVYRNGKTVRGPLCSLKYIENERRKTYRLAVVVSKKVSKSAVTRNRIRRRIYEAVRQHESIIAGPYDLVITVFGEAMATMPAEELAKAIAAQLRQAKVLDQ